MGFFVAIAMSLGIPGLLWLAYMQPEKERRQLELNKVPRKVKTYARRGFPDIHLDFPPGAFSSDTQKIGELTRENERLALRNSELMGKVNNLEHQLQKQNSPHCKCGTMIRTESMFCHKCGNRVRQMV